MKKLSLIAMCALTVVLTGCGKKGATAAQDETAATDLAMFNLTGAVKEVNIETATDSGNRSFQVMKFDEQGRLTAISATVGDEGFYEIAYDSDPNGVVTNADGMPVKRDEKGRILWVGISGGCSGEQGWHFTYTDEGMKTWTEDFGECWMMPTYEVNSWNSEGLPAEVTGSTGDEMGTSQWVMSREYTEFDDAGNWIECRMSVKQTDTEIDEDGNETSSESTSEAQDYRTIEYYE